MSKTPVQKFDEHEEAVTATQAYLFTPCSHLLRGIDPAVGKLGGRDKELAIGIVTQLLVLGMSEGI